MLRLHSLRPDLFVFVLMLLVILAPAASADPVTMPLANGFLSNCTGEYFNNVTVTGSPVFTRTDSSVNFFWPENTSPGSGLNVNNYSVRWTCTISVASDSNVTFNIVTDDGMNVLVDSNLILWAFYDQGPTSYSATIWLGAGSHTVRVEYYNRWNAGTAQVTSTASGGVTPPTPTGVWSGQYFNNISLSGSPVLVRNDSAVNFNWGETALPGPGVPHDNFSVRWDSTQNLPVTGDYTITATSDDGVRVWADGALVIDGWYDHAPTTFTATRNFAAGAHTFRVEYYNHLLGALVNVQINQGITPPPPPPGPTGVWHGQYYNNMYLSGSPVFVRDDPVLNFNWGETALPGPGVPHNYFSAKWDSVQNVPTTGNCTITATSDDGVRVWMDGAIWIDGWYDHAPVTFSATFYIAAGAHNVHVEYYNRTLGAMINVQVCSGVIPPYPGGEVIVDDGGPGWQAGGTQPWHHAYIGIGNHSYWTFNNTYAGYGYNWARWYPTLTAPGYYEVSAYVPGGIATTLNARYWVYHGGRYDLAARPQGFYANQWVSLGTHYFGATGGEFVSLASVTYECYLCRTVVYDAIRFSPR